MKHPFCTLAIVILPDHLHCLWRLPPKNDDFSTRWQILKHHFSIGVKTEKNKRREKQIWQPRFMEHFIRNEKDLRQHLDYIHYNPVKHGYTQTPIDWPYSSFKSYVKKGLYDITWGS